jgi:hypothetical protein
MNRDPAKKATAPTTRRGGSKDRKTETQKYSQPVAAQVEKALRATAHQ